MQYPFLEALSFMERAITVVSSGFNAGFFLTYRYRARRRRFGAMALVLINLTFLVEALYFGVLPHLLSVDFGQLLLDPRVRLLMGVAPMLASLLISLFVMRQLIFRRKR